MQMRHLLIGFPDLDQLWSHSPFVIAGSLSLEKPLVFLFHFFVAFHLSAVKSYWEEEIKKREPLRGDHDEKRGAPLGRSLGGKEGPSGAITRREAPLGRSLGG